MPLLPLPLKLLMSALALVALVVMSVFSVVATAGKSEGTEARLVMAQVVWRHGDRNPLATFPTDPHQRSSWHNGWGELTPLGMQQHVQLARNRLRPRYVDQLGLLNRFYVSEEVYVQSTDWPRTLASATANMAGMFADRSRPGIDTPDCEGDCWPRGLVPVPVHVKYRQLHDIADPDAVCERHMELWHLLHQTPEYLKLQEKEQKFLEFLSEQVGESITFDTLYHVYDPLFIEHLKGLPLPDWANLAYENGTVREHVNELHDILFNWENGIGLALFRGIDFAVELPKVRSGKHLWNILDRFDRKIACERGGVTNASCSDADLKYFVYSAHDSTLSSLFSTLGLKTAFDGAGRPAYTSTLAFELWHRPADRWFLKLLYFPGGAEPVDITADVTGCTAECPFEVFQFRSTDFLPIPDNLCDQPLVVQQALDAGERRRFARSWKRELAQLPLGDTRPWGATLTTTPQHK